MIIKIIIFKLTSILIFGFLTTNAYCQTKALDINPKSIFYTDSLYSDYLAEYRYHNIYLPQGFDRKKQYKIIYATDGNNTIQTGVIKSVLDSLIQNNIVEPVIYVESQANNKNPFGMGIKNNEGLSISIQYRNFEYVEEFDPNGFFPELANRFKNHMLYYIKDLIPQVEQNLNQIAGKRERLFYGFSNGAGFGINLLNKYPDIIGTYICYSPLGSNFKGNKWIKDIRYPNLYLKYGDLEDQIFKNEAIQIYKIYQKLDAFCDIKPFEGGHDSKKWNEEFIKTIREILPIKKNKLRR